MKRKLLLQFADWLEASRGPFNIGDATKCVSQKALKFERDVLGNRNARNVRPATTRSDSTDLVRIFDLCPTQANQLYLSGFEWSDLRQITRKMAAKVVRRLARTGKVDYGEFARPSPF